MFQRRLNFLLILSSHFALIKSFEIECVYINFYDHTTYGYNCKVDYHIMTSKQNQSITSVSGRHKLSYLSNDDVDRLFLFDNEKMHYIPIGFSKQFPNLNNFWIALAPLENIYQTDFEAPNDIKIIGIRGTRLNELPADVFANVKNLEEVYLYSNKLKRIDENAFRTCTKLFKVDLRENQIDYLGSIFADNPKMEEIDLRSNRIKIITSDLFSGLENLQKVDMRKNLCIDLAYPTTASYMTEINEKIEENCQNPFDGIMNDMKNSQNELAEKVDKLQTSFDEIKLEKAKLQSNLDFLTNNFTNTTEILKSERDGLLYEIKILSVNHSDIMTQLDNLISENNNLKLNITFFNISTQNDMSNARKLSEKIEKSENDMKELREEMKKLDHEKVITKISLVNIQEVYKRTLDSKTLLQQEFDVIKKNNTILVEENMNKTKQIKQLEENLGNLTLNEEKLSDDVNELQTSKFTFMIFAIILFSIFALMVVKIVTNYFVSKNRQRIGQNEIDYDLPYSNCE